MTTLNGILRYWEAFIWGIYSRRKLTKFRKIWEEFFQEEEGVLPREVKLNDNEYQALTTHAKGKHNIKSYDHFFKTQGLKRLKKDFSNYECFTCHKLGHITINSPMKAERLLKIWKDSKLMLLNIVIKK